MKTLNDGGPVFPMSATERHMIQGLSRRDWFATFAPEPSDDVIRYETERDRAANPHNDTYKPKRRSVAEIRAELRFRHADTMLAASGAPELPQVDLPSNSVAGPVWSNKSDGNVLVATLDFQQFINAAGKLTRDERCAYRFYPNSAKVWQESNQPNFDVILCRIDAETKRILD